MIRIPRLTVLLPLLTLTLFCGALWVLYHTLHAFHYHDILLRLQALPPARIVAGLALTLASYAVLTGYDYLAIRYIDRSLPLKRIGLASFISYAFSNSIGFAMLAGGSVRYRMYSGWGLSTEEIARVLAFTTATLWLGVAAAGGLAFAVRPLDLPAALHAWLPCATTLPLGLLLLALVAAYLLAVLTVRKSLVIRGWRFSLPGPGLAVAQIVVGAADWILAGAVLHVLLPASASLPLLHLLGLFLLAQIVALVSHVPGGIGIFESMILLSLPGIPADALAGSLLVYRLMYYLLPLLAAALLLGGFECFRAHSLAGRITRTALRWAAALAPQLMALAVMTAGAILLLSGATPADPGRLGWLSDFLPLAVLELSHFLGSLAGAGLLLVAWGLQRRLNAAYLVSVLLLGFGIVFSLLKGVDYEEALFLGGMLAALLPCRRSFYRRTSLLNEPFSPGWFWMILLVMGCSTWLGFFAYKHVDYSHDLWWHFTLSGDAPRFLRALVGSVTVVLLFAVAKLFRPPWPKEALPPAGDLERARPVVAASRNTVANLALLGDKRLVFNDAGNAFIMYAVSGRSWVALGDPIGPPEERWELLWRFRVLCEHAEGWPVFYEVGHDSMYLYLDLGLTLIKLGEDAWVPLAGFSLEGKARSGLRYAYRKAEKEGCSFEVVDAAAAPALLPELRAISDAWLAGKNTREKRFSLGFFQEDYLCANPVAVIRQEGRIIAFSNLWPGAEREELSVDLMRFLPEAARGVMDYLFISLLLWGKEQGFAWFNLGMAPLAGLENRPHAPLWHRIGSLVYQHGEQFYNFQGLRAYKEKFDPVWRPRYLACPGGMALPRILTNLASLISGGLQGVLGK